MLLQYAALFQPCALPHTVVNVLNRQRGQLRWPALAEGFHDRAQFFDQYPCGPTITDDVVHTEDENVLVLRKFDHLAAEQRSSG